MPAPHNLSARPSSPALSRPWIALATALCALAAVTGCRDRDVTAYRVPKDANAPAPVAMTAAQSGELPAGHPAIGAAATGQSGGAMPGNMGAGDVTMATAQGDGLTWTAPAGWTVTAGSAMRKGSFSVSGEGGAADISITAFPGDVGGELANVNRWRGQVQLPPIAPAELESALTRFESHGLKFALVDLTGPGDQPAHMLGVLVPYAGSTWFFKMTGSNALVTREKPVFVEFLHSVQPPASTP